MTPEELEEERRAVEEAKRDPARFSVLYEAHFERVYALVAGRLRNRAEAQDVTAEVFRRALSGLPRFEWRGTPVSAWFYRIAANAVASHRSRSSREGAAGVSEDLPDGAPVGEEEIARAEELARLFRSVRELPEEQRRVVLLRFVRERSVREIARELGKSEGAVKQLQYRALAALRARMGKTNG